MNADRSIEVSIRYVVTNTSSSVSGCGCKSLSLLCTKMQDAKLMLSMRICVLTGPRFNVMTQVVCRSKSEPAIGQLDLRVVPSDSVLSLKEKISKEKGTPAQEQCLDFQDSTMLDEYTLADLGVKEGAFIWLSTTTPPILSW